MFRLLVLLALAFPFAAAAQEPQPFVGIFCDSRAQIERVVTLGKELGGAALGIKAVNEEEKKAGGKENACVYTAIMGVRGPSIATINTPEGELDIVPFYVTHVRMPFGMVEVPTPPTWFSLTATQSRGA